jgi:hypothetical protein
MMVRYPRLQPWACELFDALAEAVASPDLTRLSWSKQSGYTQPGTSYLTGEIGTSGCEASLDLYGTSLNSKTGFDAVRCTPNLRISLARPTLPTREAIPEWWGCEPSHQNGSPARGVSFVPLRRAIPPHGWKPGASWRGESEASD